MWVGKFALSPEGLPAGGVAWVDLGTTAAVAPSVVNGAAYHPTYSSPDSISALYVTTEAVAASDTYIGGFRYRKDGTLRVYDATSAVPAGANTNQGIALTSDGQLCYTTGNTTSFNLNGVAVDKERRVYAAPLAFELQFADAGAGVVSTVEAIRTTTPTFTRATTATTVLSTGLIGSVASGDPRSYYDPTSLTYLGYLAEGARTNLCLSSEDLRSAAAGNPVTEWTNTDTTVTVAGTTAPDGSVNGNLCTEGTAGSAVLSNAYAATADTAQVYSIFAKAGTVTWLKLVIFEAAASTNRISGWFNLVTGAVGTATNGGTGSAAAVSIKAYPNGWYRCALSGIVGNAATALGTFNQSATADAGSTTVSNGTRYMWGAQIENNATFASSYIPTTTAAVARNADVLTYPTTGWLSTSVGTWFAQVQENVGAGADTTRKLIVGTGDAGGAWALYELYAGSGANFVTTIYDGATEVLGGGNFVPGATTKKMASAYSGVTMITCRDGTLGTAGAFDGTMNDSGTMSVGSRNDGGAPFFGPIRRVSYYAARLANATLQGLTA